MSKIKNSSNRFKISLLENGVHSLWRGIESHEEYGRTHGRMLLKDAIMFLHHGVELLMKEILVRHSPYLIFEDIRNVPKKQKQADGLGIGIFFLDQPPKTVSYEQAISRVDAFVRSPELNDNLRDRLDELNRLRNQLEHYAIEADTEEVTQLLGALQDPLLDLFEAQIGGIKQSQTPKVSQIWNGIQNSVGKYVRLEQEVLTAVRLFKGQKVPGHLLNVEGEFTLPTFIEVLENYRIPETGMRMDILGVGKGYRWAIEVKIRSAVLPVLMNLLSFSLAAKATPWLVVFSNIPRKSREKAKQLNILVTGANEWQELKRLVESQ